MATKDIACLGDGSDHGGVLTTHNQDGTVFISNLLPPSGVASGIMFGSSMFGGMGLSSPRPALYPAVEGALHDCPIPGHGVTAVTAVTVKSYINGKLILTENAIAGCGAKLAPPVRDIFVE